MNRKKARIYLSLIFAFLIGNYRGYIALWTDEGSSPARIFPYSVASLPPADQAALERGIRVESAEDLRQLLEDYLS